MDLSQRRLGQAATSCLLSAITAAVLLGCGGGGGSAAKTTTPAKASPSVLVDWPARTRNISGPSSALSASFTLQPLNVSGASIAFSGDRSNNLSAHTDTYTTSTQGAVGEYQLSATFYASAGETGVVVGTASSQVDLTASGALTQINGAALALSFSPTIQSTVVGSGQTAPFFTTTQLSATSYDSNNNVVVVSPGSYTWTQVTGSSVFSVTPDGIVTPLASGSGTVTATIDGVTSPSVSVSMSPGVMVMNYPASSFAYDSTRSVFYASVANYPTQGAFAILKLNPATGAIGGSVAMSVASTALAVSPNGSHLYATGTDGSITQIGLANMSVVGTASFPSGTFGVCASPLAMSSDSWVVSTSDSSNDDMGTYVYDSLTPRPNSAPIGLSIDTSADGTSVFGYQCLLASTPRQYNFAIIGDSGITVSQTVTPSFQGQNTWIHYFDSAIVADDGTVADPTTGTTLNSFGITSTGHAAAGTPTGTRVYFVESQPMQVVSGDLSSTSVVGTYSLPSSVTGTLSCATFVGTGAVAFRNSGGTSNQFFIVAGLP